MYLKVMASQRLDVFAFGVKRKHHQMGLDHSLAR